MKIPYKMILKNDNDNKKAITVKNIIIYLDF